MSRARIALGVVAVLAALSVPLLPRSVAILVDPAPVVSAIGIVSIGLGALLWVQQGLFDSSRADGRESTTTSTTVDTASMTADGRPEWRGDRVGWRVDTGIELSPAALQVSPFRIKRVLRRTLDTTLVDLGGLSAEQAVEHRRAGSWTDDPRAATFLGEVDVRPWSLRVRDWLTGDAFAKNLRAAAEEIDRVATEIDRSGRADLVLERRQRDAVGVRGLGPDVDPEWADTTSFDGYRGTANRRRIDHEIDERASAANRSEVVDTAESGAESTVPSDVDLIDEVSR